MLMKETQVLSKLDHLCKFIELYNNNYNYIVLNTSQHEHDLNLHVSKSCKTRQSLSHK